MATLMPWTTVVWRPRRLVARASLACRRIARQTGTPFRGPPEIAMGRIESSPTGARRLFAGSAATLRCDRFRRVISQPSRSGRSTPECVAIGCGSAIFNVIFADNAGALHGERKSDE